MKTELSIARGFYDFETVVFPFRIAPFPSELI